MTVATKPDAASEPRATYRDLFGVSEFRTLFGAQVVSMLGTMVSNVALTVLVYERTRSTLLAALTFTVSFLPFLIGGTLLTSVVDRLPPRRVLVGCDLASAAVFALMALHSLPVVALFALTFVGGLAAPLFGGVKSALLPEILGAGQRYVLGRATTRMVSQGAQVVGFGLGGVLVAAVGARAALGIDAASFAMSAVVIRLGLAHRAAILPTPAAGGSKTVSSPARGSMIADSLVGLGRVLSHGPTRRILLLRWVLPTCALAPEALAAAYVRAIHAPESAIGPYLAAIPLAMVAVDLVAGRALGARGQARLIVPGALLCEAPLLAFLAMPALPAAVALLVLTGLGYCHALGLDRLLVTTPPAALRARALAIDQAGLMVLQGAGFAVWGGLAELLPLRITIALAGAVGLACVALLAPRVLRPSLGPAHPLPSDRAKARDCR